MNIFIDIKGSSTYYILSRSKVCIKEPYENMSRIYHRLRFVMNYFHISFNFAFRINSEIKCEEKDVVILMGSLLYKQFLLLLRKKYSKARIIYCYPNIVNDIASVKPKILDELNIEKYSWDIDDCKRYNIQYINSYYLNDSKLISSDYVYDVVFIGADKNRYKKLKEIEFVLRSAGKKVLFYITPSHFFSKWRHKDYKLQITYDEYLNIVSKALCIVDFTQQGQIGPSLRTFEAIFNKKKLITNNLNIVNFDFYNDYNFFILRDNNYSKLLSFVEEPYYEVDGYDAILQKYTYEAWCQQLNI